MLVMGHMHSHKGGYLWVNTQGVSEEVIWSWDWMRRQEEQQYKGPEAGISWVC